MATDRFYVKIDVAVYNDLIESKRLLKEFIHSDKCVSVRIYEHGGINEQYIVNPPPDFKALAVRLEQDVEERSSKYWSLKNLYKKITLFDIGKRIYDIVK